MKRGALIALAVATAAVAYALVGGRLLPAPFGGWFQPNRRLPALKSAELPFRYPAQLWRSGVEGEVVLKVHITATGSVDSVLLERSSGHPQLDTVALTGARELKYHPARQGETPMAVWATLPVYFQRNSDPPVEVGN